MTGHKIVYLLLRTSSMIKGSISCISYYFFKSSRSVQGQDGSYYFFKAAGQFKVKQHTKVHDFNCILYYVLLQGQQILYPVLLLQGQQVSSRSNNIKRSCTTSSRAADLVLLLQGQQISSRSNSITRYKIVYYFFKGRRSCTLYYFFKGSRSVQSQITYQDIRSCTLYYFFKDSRSVQGQITYQDIRSCTLYYVLLQRQEIQYIVLLLQGQQVSSRSNNITRSCILYYFFKGNRSVQGQITYQDTRYCTLYYVLLHGQQILCLVLLLQEQQVNSRSNTLYQTSKYLVPTVCKQNCVQTKRRMVAPQHNLRRIQTGREHNIITQKLAERRQVVFLYLKQTVTNSSRHSFY